MALRAQRRLLCLVTALLFAIGSVAYVHAATIAAIEMGTAPMEASAPDDGIDCCGKDKAADIDCVAMCATAVAILSDPIAVPFAVVVTGVAPAPELPPTSHGPSLDPHPPKY
jgi:hypothetical protein